MNNTFVKNIINEEEKLHYNPFNPLNKEITKHDVETILSKYGIHEKINNIELYKRAFVHNSYTKKSNIENINNNIVIVECPKNCIPLKTKSNERLEFIGDGVLELITKYYLYRRFTKADEGFMTEKKIALVKNEHIGKLAFDMKLNKWLLISKHAEEKNTRNNFKKLGCLFEAFIGALFLDFNKISVNDEHGWFKNVFVTGPGFQMAQIFIENIFEEHVDWMKIIEDDDNYKNILQIKIQKEFKITPNYIEINYCNDTNLYEMGVFICIGCTIHTLNYKDAILFSNFGSFLNIHKYLENNDKVFIFLGSGKYKIKKKAEQIACYNALKNII